MPIIKTIISYFLTIVVFATMDLTWLGFIAKNLYKKHLGEYLTGAVNWPAAIAFYLIFILGIFIFAISPALKKDSVTTAIIYGALFGFFTYATYDLTNMAVLKNWPLAISIIDILWGAFIVGTVSAAGFYIFKYLG